MSGRLQRFLAVLTIVGVVAAAESAHAGMIVDTELALLVDVSGSISSSEFNLQTQGIASAFRSSQIQNLVSSGNGIAVSLVYWSGQNQQSQVVDWFYINNAATANQFANLVEAAPRMFDGQTAPGNALEYITNPSKGSKSFSENNFDGARQVIDISGDGVKNEGSSASSARDKALDWYGVDQINGLVIGGDWDVYNFYEDNLIGGDDAFVMKAKDFGDFKYAFQQKLFRELTPVPEPASLALLGLSLCGGVFYNRRKRNSKTTAE